MRKLIRAFTERFLHMYCAATTCDAASRWLGRGRRVKRSSLLIRLQKAINTTDKSYGVSDGRAQCRKKKKPENQWTKPTGPPS